MKLIEVKQKLPLRSASEEIFPSRVDSEIKTNAKA